MVHVLLWIIEILKFLFNWAIKSLYESITLWVVRACGDVFNIARLH